ncbi:hypothetical protein GH714_026481 [Hevea brasiliensis]|uniref:Uncharacterized protein n=1 Tax=Hevea brasiliensis TaxID=3981 RepID=A0A6A6MEQ7_HEVBR|nr:hypothetical protein GH714_026481 [Hevea brasiliensis]
MGADESSSPSDKNSVAAGSRPGLSGFDDPGFPIRIGENSAGGGIRGGRRRMRGVKEEEEDKAKENAGPEDKFEFDRCGFWDLREEFDGSN